MLNNQVSMSLDADNIPKDYRNADFDMGYLMSYSELYVNDGADSRRHLDDDMTADDSFDPFEDCDRDANNEAVFRINKQTLQEEYNLVTLNLEKVHMINLKDVVERHDRVIGPSDLQLVADWSKLGNRETQAELLRKREQASLDAADLEKIIQDAETFSQKKLKQHSEEDKSELYQKEPHDIKTTVQKEIQEADGSPTYMLMAALKSETQDFIPSVIGADIGQSLIPISEDKKK